MRRILIPLILAAAACAAAVSDADRFAATSVRADRSFEWREWPGAAALYEVMLALRPDSAEIYARAIVASDMAGDTAAVPELIERAMSHGIGFAPLLGRVRATLYGVGEGDAYGSLLTQLRRDIPYMGRALDHELLTYYTFRSDGPRMVEYAQTMLRGLPESEEYLDVLARGYMLQGRYDEAAATWRHILSLYPDNYQSLLYLGNLCASTGDSAGARRYLERAQALHPTPYVQATLDSLP